MKLCLVVLVCACVSVGCSTGPIIDPFHMPGPPPGKINHVVFIDLIDSADTSELILNLEDLFSIPGVASGYVGAHYDIGRETVLQDYDVGFFVAFDSEDDYRAYVEHAAHVAFIEKWKARWDSIRVYDVGDARLLSYETDQ
ncbi:MAG: Dabb family protein [Phycisphaerales bacterium]|nr:Dabb family protein [Phycisphaerales bacterium]MCB9836345.1 Dabb family protein [Phycisphaera sp.]